MFGDPHREFLILAPSSKSLFSFFPSTATLIKPRRTVYGDEGRKEGRRGRRKERQKGQGERRRERQSFPSSLRPTGRRKATALLSRGRVTVVVAIPVA